MYSIFGLLAILTQLLQLMFFARFIAQLIDPSGGNAITRFLVEITEPILAPVRRLIPSVGGLDLSPMIVLFGLFFLQRFLASA